MPVAVPMAVTAELAVELAVQLAAELAVAAVCAAGGGAGRDAARACGRGGGLGGGHGCGRRPRRGRRRGGEGACGRARCQDMVHRMRCVSDNTLRPLPAPRTACSLPGMPPVFGHESQKHQEHLCLGCNSQKSVSTRERII